MITSMAAPHTLDKIRRLSGPNPEDSHLTDIERLHLIFLLGKAMSTDFGPEVQTDNRSVVMEALKERGMSTEHFAHLFGELTLTEHNPVDLADTIAVHPSIRHAGYLD